MFGIFGALGQTSYNAFDASRLAKLNLEVSSQLEDRKSLWHRMAQSKWSPIQVLPDEEYEQILKEKILKIDVDLAMLEEDIEKLKSDSQQDGDSISPPK